MNALMIRCMPSASLGARSAMPLSVGVNSKEFQFGEQESELADVHLPGLRPRTSQFATLEHTRNERPDPAPLTNR
jgi:hypothetical protein